MVDVSNPSIKEQKQSVSSTSEVLKTRPKNYKSGAEVSQAGSNKKLTLYPKWFKSLL